MGAFHVYAIRIIAATSLIAALAVCGACATWAQGQAKTPPKAAQPPAKKPATAAPTQPAAKAPAQPAAAAPLSEADQKAKQAILQGDRWRQAIHAMNEWLSVQQVYTPQQVQALQQELDYKVQAMSPADLEALLGRMESKLSVLLSPDAQAARDWIGQNLAVMAAKPREEFKRSLPDPVSMTPTQMRQELESFRQRQASRQQAQTALQQGREQRVQNVRSQRTQIAPTGQSTGTGSCRPASTRCRASTAPRSQQYTPGFMQRPSYYVTPWGGVGQILPR